MNIDDLKVYTIASQLEVEVFEITNQIEYSWKIAQVYQVKRSSSSVSANINEGWSRRFYPKDYIRFLAIALGSCDETKHHIKVMYNIKCVSEPDYLNLYKKYKNLSVRILNLINYLKKKYKIYTQI
ncbi:four helix bundle protein [Candidatus Peregrinibacteria bacterium]|nr:four helix bundle protein [Candidatus Peregrinibacteria bacterium]